jgi:hypothetical protein
MPPFAGHIRQLGFRAHQRGDARFVIGKLQRLSVDEARIGHTDKAECRLECRRQRVH